MFTWLKSLIRFNSVTLGLCLTLMVLLLFWLDETHDGKKPLLVEPFHRLELLAADLRFGIRGTSMPGPEVVIAAIDEKSIDQLGRWPWPYTVQADLIRRLTAYGVASIGYDVVFSSSDTSAGKDGLQALQDSLASRNYFNDKTLKAQLQHAVAAADHDQIFAAALAESGRTVLGYFFHWQCQDVAHLNDTDLARFLQDLTTSTNARYTPRIAAGASLKDLHLEPACAVEANLPVLSKAVWGNGFFNSRPDTDDGVIRRYPLVARHQGRQKNADTTEQSSETVERQEDLFAPLGIRVLERYLIEQYGHASTLVSIDANQAIQVWLVAGAGREHRAIPVDHRGRMVINHLGPSELREGETAAPGQRYRFPRYSIADIVRGNVQEAPPKAFRNKIVLIGATAVGLSDLRLTPFDSAFPGVETHATIIDNVLRQHFLVAPWWGSWFTTINILLVGALLMVGLPYLGPLRGDIATIALIAGNAGLNYWLFLSEGLQLNLVYPFLTIVVVWLGMTIYHFVFEQKQSRYLRRTFSTYLSPDLVDMMVDKGIEPQLGGSSGVRTAYFTDIASFSSFSEVLTATQLVELLNEYLSAMTDLLLAEGGTLDKYEGDAIVAFFGAPIEQPDHAQRALRVALGMQHALDGLRQKWQDEGEKWPALVHDMRMRIGISSGDIVTGNMGSTMRMNYTMMGDVVNTAARLEAASKQYGVYIQCTTETLDLAGRETFEWRELDKVRVVGKTDAIETVEIMAHEGQLSAEQTQMRDLYTQGLALYRQQHWEEAIAKFTESAKLEEVFPGRPTTPSQVYIERCTYFKEYPPEQPWDGSWTLTTK
jgi:adenylate cyclase